MWGLLVKILIVLLVAVSTIGFYKLKTLDTATKIILGYVSSAAITEIVAFYYAITEGDNILVYNIYPIIQLLIITLYFHIVHKRYVKSKIPMISAIIGITFYIINAFTLQDIVSKVATNFLVSEAIIIVFLCLHYMYVFFKKTNYSIPTLEPSFIIICILLLYWSFTYFYWLTGMTIRANNTAENVWIRYIFWSFNFLEYMSLGIVFLLYNNKLPKHE